jgi:hypothetical protein
MMLGDNEERDSGVAIYSGYKVRVDAVATAKNEQFWKITQNDQGPETVPLP